ncbi:sulfite reductase [NADPH] flavoprotein alpha-component [Steroidobacter agaridevorans]|uniref:Sulfite reductase [NADPH] flavoprotein alpha-component n=1 Tax=Steroidobacter agaridevorans TaxID=2695856 RepID=A0A829YJT7_9GAMM|nr:assimilatory sulfite reductase (NADPH) flavoprotein subunit [Steroidobacter agaridevorans]GFE83565.1 sulfite reductase [NADPH] flavoprotein alpha-component [Steroidobacter agaridevorans]
MSESAIARPPAEAFPFEPSLAEEVRRLVGRLDSGQRAWLSGYLLGSIQLGGGVATAAASNVAPTATILFGSQSGNCEALAKRLDEALAGVGVSRVMLDMLDCRKADLEQARHLLVIVSTHGEGDPPDRARPLYDLLHGRKAPKLANLKYSVLALGDSSYERFCEVGRRFDAQLESLGAQRLHERIECDVDFQESANRWIEKVVSSLAAAHSEGAQPAVLARPSATIATAYTRKNPWQAPVLANIRLTARASSKDVRHIELSLEGSGIHYEPGDALGVVPRNQEAHVDALFERLPFDPESAVEIGGASLSLRAALTDQLDIGPLNRRVLERYAELTAHGALSSFLQASTEQQLETALRGYDLLELVREYPPQGIGPEQLVQILRPLAPRLYSIASSPHATPDEVHLTVRIVTYESRGRVHGGVVSTALASATDAHARIAVYPHRNPAFRLPSDPSAPIVMIGPGTGVAPFRSFVAEREALGARGKSWLLFGDRTLRNDFLYQTEWLDWRKRGALHRLDVAFSRDGDEKLYVQHRIREHGATFYEWLREGAYVYVCGDAQQMAPDVDAAIRQVVARHGGLGEEQVEEFMLNLQRERRYQRDVY